MIFQKNSPGYEKGLFRRQHGHCRLLEQSPRFFPHFTNPGSTSYAQVPVDNLWIHDTALGGSRAEPLMEDATKTHIPPPQRMAVI